MKFFVATDLTVTHGKIMALNELGSTMPTYFFAKLDERALCGQFNYPTVV